jgi:CRP-like cAMP-binding protein
VALELAVPGREPLVLETLGEGELVGASWLLPPARVHFDVRSRGRVTTLRMESACLWRILKQDSAFGYTFCRRFMEVLVKRLQATRLQLMDLYGHPELYPPCRREPAEEPQ